MTLSQLLLILYARRKVLIGTLVLTMLTTFLLTLSMPKSYEASTTLVMNFKGADPVTGVTMPAQMIPGYMATQVDIIQSKSVALGVVETLKLDQDPPYRQKFIKKMRGEGDIKDWLADALLKDLAVEPSHESSVLVLNFKGSDPALVAAIANTFASEYKKIAIQLRVQPLKDASAYFNGQMQAARANLEQAQSRVSRYQQEKGLVSADDRLDVESARLNELSTQLVAVQGQLAEAQSRQRQLGRGAAGEAPDVLGNPIVQALSAQLAQAEARFSDVAAKLAPKHPNYQAAQAEVAKIRASLAAQVRMTSNSVASSARMLQGREAELRTSLENQKARVLELNRARDELAVLTRDVDSAQRAYDALLTRLSQASLEGQSNQTEVAVLSPALAPVNQSSPRMFLNMALSLVLGLVFGGGVAVLAEMLDRRVRSQADLETGDAPFLGVVSIARTANTRQGRPASRMRALTAKA